MLLMMVVENTALSNLPQVFSWVEIWSLRWPLHMIYNVHALHTFNKSWHLREIFQCYIMYVHYIQSECLLSSLLSDLHDDFNHAYVCQYICICEFVCLYNCCICCVHTCIHCVTTVDQSASEQRCWCHECLLVPKLSWTLKVNLMI